MRRWYIIDTLHVIPFNYCAVIILLPNSLFTYEPLCYLVGSKIKYVYHAMKLRLFLSFDGFSQHDYILTDVCQRCTLF